MESKKQILRIMFDQAIEGDSPHLMVIQSGPAIVVSLNGSSRGLTNMLVESMDKDKRIVDIFKHAIMIHEIGDLDLPDLIKKLLNFTPGDCESCPVEDVCPIKDDVKKDCDPAIREMKDLINKKKGGK